MIAFLLLALGVLLSLALSKAALRTGASRKEASGIAMLLQAAAFILLAAFAGTRVDVGRDYGLYSTLFMRVDPMQWEASIQESPQEIGFTSIMLAVQHFDDDPRALFAVISILTIASVWLALRLAKADLLPAVAVYVFGAIYLQPFNGIRQGMAVALLFLAVMLWSRSRLATVLVAAAAVLIHVSALVIVPILILTRVVRFGRVSVIVFSIFALAGGVILEWMPWVLDVLASLNERYVDYVRDFETAGFGTYLVATTHLVLALCLFRWTDATERERWWRRIYALTPALAYLGTAIPLAARLADYTMIFLLPIIPRFVTHLSHKALWSILLLGLGLGYYVVYILNYGGLLPYQSWLFPGVWR